MELVLPSQNFGLGLFPRFSSHKPRCDLSQLLRQQLAGFEFVQDGKSLRDPTYEIQWVGIMYSSEKSLLVATAYPAKLIEHGERIQLYTNQDQERITRGLERIASFYN